MSNWPYRSGPIDLAPPPGLHVQDRFGERDLPEICRLYRSAGVPRPPDVAALRHLLAESDLVVGLRDGRHGGRLVAFARALTDFTRDVVILDVLADPQAATPASRLRASVVAALVASPVLREVANIDVRSSNPSDLPSPRAPMPSSWRRRARGSRVC